MGICCIPGNGRCRRRRKSPVTPSTPLFLTHHPRCTGPSKWSKTYPIAVTGTRQSPIDIRTDACSCHDKSQPLVIQYPETITAPILKNSGYGWVVNIPKDDSLRTCLIGGPLDDKYILEQFHAHWGADCGCGSEHTVDGKSYAAELHLVHWNSRAFSSFPEAASQSKGLAVLAVFLDIGLEANPEFEKLTEKMAEIRFKGETTTLSQPLRLSNLLPSDKCYWTYEGSLTTPPLYESVTWLVLKMPVKVSAAQIDKFRSICYHKKNESPGEGDGRIVQNFRPAQPLCNRVVVFETNA